MPTDYDTWLTTTEDDDELCQAHGVRVPCATCRMQAQIEAAERMKEAEREEQ